jgi:hypothetical protein
MNKRFSPKFVKRGGASSYLLLMLISFALSVTLTRAFLELAGYPQLGNSEFHIAHVLWGGLFLFIASLLPLIFANRKIYWLTALISGVGVGLFIDEVGKFITQSNDYFYPLAAPIIYASFLLSVLVYLSTRVSKSETARATLYDALERLTEAVDGEMNQAELLQLKENLNSLALATNESRYRNLSQSLLQFLQAEDLVTNRAEQSLFYRLRMRWQKFSNAWFTAKRLKWALLLGLGLLALQSFLQFGLISYVFYQMSTAPDSLVWHFNLIVLPTQFIEMRWLLVMFTFDLAVGLILAYAFGLLLLNHELRAARWAILGLVLALTTVSLFLFYYNQFASVGSNLLYLVMLLLANLYQQRISASENSPA